MFGWPSTVSCVPRGNSSRSSLQAHHWNGGLGNVKVFSGPWNPSPLKRSTQMGNPIGWCMLMPHGKFYDNFNNSRKQKWIKPFGKVMEKKIDGNFGDLGFRNSIWDPGRTPFFAIFFTKEWSSPPFLSFRHNPSFGSICFHGKTLESFSKIKLTWYYGCFLKRWYPQNHPKKWSFLVGKPIVVGYHHCASA